MMNLGEVIPSPSELRVALSLEIRLVSAFVKSGVSPPKEYKCYDCMKFREYDFYYRPKAKQKAYLSFNRSMRFREILNIIKDCIVKNKKRDYFIRIYNVDRILMNTKELLIEEFESFSENIQLRAPNAKRIPNSGRKRASNGCYLNLVCYLFNKTVCFKLLPFIAYKEEKDLAESFLKYGSIDSPGSKVNSDDSDGTNPQSSCVDYPSNALMPNACLGSNGTVTLIQTPNITPTINSPRLPMKSLPVSYGSSEIHPNNSDINLPARNRNGQKIQGFYLNPYNNPTIENVSLDNIRTNVELSYNPSVDVIHTELVPCGSDNNFTEQNKTVRTMTNFNLDSCVPIFDNDNKLVDPFLQEPLFDFSVAENKVSNCSSTVPNIIDTPNCFGQSYEADINKNNTLSESTRSVTPFLTFQPNDRIGRTIESGDYMSSHLVVPRADKDKNDSVNSGDNSRSGSDMSFVNRYATVHIPLELITPVNRFIDMLKNQNHAQCDNCGGPGPCLKCPLCERPLFSDFGNRNG